MNVYDEDILSVNFIGFEEIAQGLKSIVDTDIQIALDYANSSAVQSALAYAQDSNLRESIIYAQKLIAEAQKYFSEYEYDSNFYQHIVQGSAQKCGLEVLEPQKLANSVSLAVNAATQYAPRELINRCQIHIKPMIKNIFKGKITFSDILMLCSILIALWGITLQVMPNEQLQQIIAQNDVIIRQNEDMLAQNETLIDLQEKTLKERSEANSILNDLVDALNLFTDELHFFGNADHGSSDDPDREGQTDVAQTQQYNADA